MDGCDSLADSTAALPLVQLETQYQDLPAFSQRNALTLPQPMPPRGTLRCIAGMRVSAWRENLDKNEQSPLTAAPVQVRRPRIGAARRQRDVLQRPAKRGLPTNARIADIGKTHAGLSGIASSTCGGRKCLTELCQAPELCMACTQTWTPGICMCRTDDTPTLPRPKRNTAAPAQTGF
eukprot:357822-Chlamydomonas_euryale.AAC.2